MQSCTGEESAARPADFLDIADILVDVGVHGHRNLGMSGNALQGFDVYAPRGLQVGQESVTKHVRGHTLGKADFLAEMLPRRLPHTGREHRSLACDCAESVPAPAAGVLPGALPWTWLAFLWVSC